MQVRTFRLRAFALLLLLAASLAPASLILKPAIAPSNSYAQVQIPPEALADETVLAQVLQKGEQLEQQRRWGDAMSHYEEALKSFPGRRDLQQRLTLARIRFDLCRRYSDASFTEHLERMTERQALDLYSEVLVKIYMHYVQAPNWQDLIHRGASHLDAALAEPLFIERNLPQVGLNRIEAFRRQLHHAMQSRAVRNQHEAREAVILAARLAWQELGLSPQPAILEYACGAASSLDEYSCYLTGGQLDDIFSQIEGNFVGLGIELKADDQSLLIVSVIGGGPADQAGIRGGDRIVEVDGQSTTQVSTDRAADMLKGPEGSAVELVVVTPQETSRKLRIVRRRVEVPSVEDVKIIDANHGVGYIRLSSFQKTTGRDLDAALWRLHRQGMQSLIVDVRGNPGGLLTAAVEAADKFLSQGAIVSTRGRSPREDFDYKAHAVGTWRVPLVVLIDGESASASEIFASAIRDHRRGAVVGQRSYGKGSVQGIFPLHLAKGGVRLTTARFYSPSGHPISNRGVEPDVLVHATAKPAGESEVLPAEQDADAILNAGLQIARRRVSQRRQ